MDARMLIICFALFKLAVDGILFALQDRQRKKPLPPDVADVYSPERYRDYLSSVIDGRRA